MVLTHKVREALRGHPKDVARRVEVVEPFPIQGSFLVHEFLDRNENTVHRFLHRRPSVKTRTGCSR